MSSRWTPDEIQYISDNAGVLNYAELSRKLGRSEEAIKLCRCRRRLPRFYDTFYSYSLLSTELGRSRATLRKYYNRDWLVGKRAAWSCKYGKHPMIFTEDNIVDFLHKFSHLFDWKKIPNPYFRNVVKDCLLDRQST
jgi:hypothetical protein